MKYKVANKKLFVNDPQLTKQVFPPTISDIMNIDKQENDKMHITKHLTSDKVKEKGSTFVALAAKVSSVAEIKRAYRKVKLFHPEADHVMVAYNTSSLDGYHDDGEHGSGLN